MGFPDAPMRSFPLDGLPFDPNIQKVWPVDENTITNYLDCFSNVLTTESYLLQQKVFDVLRTRRLPVIIDAMASPAALISLAQILKKPIFGLSIGGSYQESSHIQKLRELLGISHLSANICSIETLEKIDKWRDGASVDLWIERAVGGLQHVPNRPGFYDAAIRNIYKRLNPNGGIALIMTPGENILEERGVNVQKWLELLQAHGFKAWFNPYYEFIRDPDTSYGLFMLEKDPDHPELPKIPILFDKYAQFLRVTKSVAFDLTSA